MWIAKSNTSKHYGYRSRSFSCKCLFCHFFFFCILSASKIEEDQIKSLLSSFGSLIDFMIFLRMAISTLFVFLGARISWQHWTIDGIDQNFTWQNHQQFVDCRWIRDFDGTILSFAYRESSARRNRTRSVDRLIQWFKWIWRTSLFFL